MERWKGGIAGGRLWCLALNGAQGQKRPCIWLAICSPQPADRACHVQTIVVGCVLISKGYLARQGAWVKRPCTGALWCMCISSFFFFLFHTLHIKSHLFCPFLSDLHCQLVSVLLHWKNLPSFLQIWYFSIVCRLLAVRLDLNRLCDRLSEVFFFFF